MRPRRTRQPLAAKSVDSRLRIIGGELRRRTIAYDGNPALRPMKDRVRESLFNLLGPQVTGKSVIDLFAGTGAVSFEALSRGAKHASLVERQFPIVKLIRETAASLGMTDRTSVIPGDAFRWAPQHALAVPPAWVVFFCPPYDFYVSRNEEMLNLIRWMWQHAAAESMFVVESDNRFDVTTLPDPSQWQVRAYPPAVLSLARKPESKDDP